MPTTPTYSLPYPQASDPADVPTDMQELAVAVEAALGDVAGSIGGASIGTSLPSSPANGDEAILVDSLTAPTYAWRFVYVSSIADAYKWLFVGGGPAVASVPAAESRANGSYGALSTPGPTITVPRAGIYDVTIGCKMNGVSGDAGATAYMTFDVGGTAGTDLEALQGIIRAGNGNSEFSGDRSTRKTIAAAATALTSKYRTGSATNNGTFSGRQMAVRPVRVA